MRLDDSSLASLLLVNRLVETSAKPLTAGEYWSLLSVVDDPAALLGLGVDQLAGVLPASVDTGRVAALLDAATALAFELERLEQSGIRTITPFDEPWPNRLVDRLGPASPSVLYVAGPVEQLAVDGLGVVGSRDVSSEGAEVARAAAGVAVDLGVPVVSGGARGVDQAAMAASIDSGGSTVGVLADSLAAALRESETRRAVLDGVACLATPYNPSAAFTAAGALGRNKIIYALSRLTFVVASDLEKGGTWGGATESIKRGFGRVTVWSGDGAGPGNAAIGKQGAVAVASVDQLRDAFEADVELVRPDDPDVPEVVVQQSLL